MSKSSGDLSPRNRIEAINSILSILSMCLALLRGTLCQCCANVSDQLPPGDPPPPYCLSHYCTLSSLQPFLGGSRITVVSLHEICCALFLLRSKEPEGESCRCYARGYLLDSGFRLPCNPKRCLVQFGNC